MNRRKLNRRKFLAALLASSALSAGGAAWADEAKTEKCPNCGTIKPAGKQCPWCKASSRDGAPRGEVRS